MNDVMQYCSNKQKEALARQDWASAQDYQDMATMWKKRFEQADKEAAKAA